MIFFSKLAKGPLGRVFGAIHDRAPGLMIGLAEVGASLPLFSGGGLRTGVAILLVTVGAFDIRQGIKHYLRLAADD